MDPSSRVLVQSVDGPYVLIELGRPAIDLLERVREAIRGDQGALGLLGMVIEAPPGLVVRYASGLTSDSVASYRKLFGDPLNERGPHFLSGFRVTRVHVFLDSFWLYAVDDSDPTHLPEVNRSDSVSFADLSP
jgi:hypothetical protein